MTYPTATLTHHERYFELTYVCSSGQVDGSLSGKCHPALHRATIYLAVATQQQWQNFLNSDSVKVYEKIPIKWVRLKISGPRAKYIGVRTSQSVIRELKKPRRRRRGQRRLKN